MKPLKRNPILCITNVCKKNLRQTQSSIPPSLIHFSSCFEFHDTEPSMVSTLLWKSTEPKMVQIMAALMEIFSNWAWHPVGPIQECRENPYSQSLILSLTLVMESCQVVIRKVWQSEHCCCPSCPCVWLEIAPLEEVGSDNTTGCFANATYPGE